LLDHGAVAFVVLIYVIVYLITLKLNLALARLVLTAGGAVLSIGLFVLLVAAPSSMPPDGTSMRGWDHFS
jgi:hypothetical protein